MEAPDRAMSAHLVWCHSLEPGVTVIGPASVVGNEHTLFDCLTEEDIDRIEACETARESVDLLATILCSKLPLFRIKEGRGYHGTDQLKLRRRRIDIAKGQP